ncbi:MAG: hypothetical protein HN778_19445 [Prolixibacteraceae bacterium]|jgi:hypothetical protein|nr:hypothetical protein [Prolixibacteraceae bacterium]MBT6006445.1 hypothetical protein [Prolixibacteraceae bacterium]MBT7000809.1 hypothetical protein [Prolixibacteraceae bacterium]MBT7397012.1 hypothetical protein [Prolixibacteraceae bacterium]
MKDNKMEVFSNLTKHDTVVAIEEKILPGSLVFDSLNPFPGYYHETPTNVRPIYLYLVLDKQYTLERVLRASQSIAKEYNWDLDAGKGYMSIGSEFLNVIRVRHLPELDLVGKIQEAYINHNINFLMNKKLKGKLQVEVKISKFLMLEEIGEGVYINPKEPSFGYIEIPKYLHREAFAKVSMDVKYNWDGSEYDAASGSFYNNGKLSEVVRILSNKNNANYLLKIRQLYLDKIR